MNALTGREMARILERKGWTLVRIRSSHHRYEKAGHAPVTVPVHAGQTLKIGLQRAIMKAAGLTENDL
jgi:predicted RNA binding protein YcfA (HicA-like mRNA interferase family)